MLKKSLYIIEQYIEESDLYLLFSTKSAEWIYLNREEYEYIRRNDIDADLNIVKDLIKKQMLVEDSLDERAELFNERKNNRQLYNDRPVTNYVITPTMDCNARCYYCYEHTSCQEIHYDNMSNETAERIAEFIIKSSSGTPFTIHWYGGEPLLKYDVIDRISTILNEKHMTYISNITTNGYFIDQTVIKRMKENWHIHLIKITVDDIGEKYNIIKNYKEPCVANPFEHVMSNIRNALKAGLKVRLRTNYNPLDIGQIEKMHAYLQDYFENSPYIHFHFTPIDANSKTIPALADLSVLKEEHPFFKAMEYEQGYKIEEKSELNTEIEEELSKLFTPWCNMRSKLEHDEVSKILCEYYLYPVPFNCLGVCDNSLAIDSRGDIYICHKLLGLGTESSCGNVITGIEKNEIYSYYQNIEVEQECDECVLLPVCGGGCKYRRKNYSNHHHLPIKGIEKEAVRIAIEKIEAMRRIS